MQATRDLARCAVRLREEGADAAQSERVALVLLDLWAVTVAGARTPELTALAAAPWGPPGPVRPLGSDRGTGIEAACALDAVASCCLELDEGNKYAAGHPAAHVVPAAVAATRLAPGPVDGRRFVAAVVAGYEVAARFGRALRRDQRWHTHGHWGATGAAAAAALVLGADEDQVAAAIDTAGALLHVTPWPVVLEGHFVRNLWMAGANRAGLDAARLALAGLARNTGAVQHSLGGLVGELDPAELVRGLGEEWLVLQGYAKQHASCSYTHAVVDAVQALRADAAWDVADVHAVEVATHSLAAPLLDTEPTSRLAAMFCLPFVTAVALVSGSVDPGTMDPASTAFGRARELMPLVRVTLSPDLDALLPRRRAAEVTIRLRDGSSLAVGVPTPVGDVDHLPLGRAELLAKARRLVGEADADRVAAVVDGLAASPDVRVALDRLP